MSPSFSRHQTNEIYFDFFISMWYIKFSAYLIDWKDNPSIQIHLTILCIFPRNTKAPPKKKRPKGNAKGKKKTFHEHTKAWILWIFPFILFGVYRKSLKLPFVKDHLFPLKRFVNYLFFFFHSFFSNVLSSALTRRGSSFVNDDELWSIRTHTYTHTHSVRYIQLPISLV